MLDGVLLSSMDNIDLATEIIGRLNQLIADPNVRQDVQRLIDQRLAVSQEAAEHPTLQVSMEDGVPYMGLLGVLNGLVGVYPSGHPKDGWGYISAYYDDDNRLVRFELTASSSGCKEH